MKPRQEGGTPVRPNEEEQNRRWQVVEVLIFLALIVPSTVLGTFVYRQERVGFTLVAWATLSRDVALVALILYFLWRSGEPLRALGWRFRWADVLLGVVLFPVVAFAASLLGVALRAAGLSAPSPATLTFLRPHGPAELALAVVLAVVVAVAEETMFRGYLLLRLRNLGAGAVQAVVVSALLFSLGHGYEGSAGMVTVAALGAVFAAIYLWRGSLAAPIVMHFLQDFIGLVALSRS